MALRGDVVIVDFPFTDQQGTKRRPAVVVQAEVYNRMISKSVIAMVTGNLKRIADPAHLFIDPQTSDGASSGLRAPSLVSCNNLFTVDQEDFVRTLRSSSTNASRPPWKSPESDCADVLYGVTMQESGISRRMAVRFEDWPDEQHPEEKAGKGALTSSVRA
jgi:mRNA interferase MazF